MTSLAGWCCALGPDRGECYCRRDLDAANADVLIGSDVIAVAGGLHIEYDSNDILCSIRFGDTDHTVAAVSPKMHPSPHVKVVREDDDVILRAEEAEVRWKSEEKFWELTWRWKEKAPTSLRVWHQ